MKNFTILFLVLILIFSGTAEAQLVINTGSGPNTGTGDPALTAFTKINSNFANLAPQLFLVTNPTYGAKFDATTLSDITTTYGSAIITSASYQFQASDVGKDIILWAGSLAYSSTGTVTSGSNVITGLASTTSIEPLQAIKAEGMPAGTYVIGVKNSTSVIASNYATSTATASVYFVNPWNTTIASVTNGAATLAATSIATSAGATFPSTGYPTAVMTFGTDSTAAIQAAVNAASSAGGGAVVLPNGATMVSSQINWASNVSLIGQGMFSSDLIWASPLNMGTATTSAMIFAGGFGGGGPSSATTPFTNIFMSNFQIDMSAATEGTLTYLASCVAIPYTVNWQITNTYMHGSPASCIRNDYARGNVITQNYFANTGRLSNGGGTGGNTIGSTYAESAAYPTSGIVQGNYFYDPGVTAILYQATSGQANTQSDTVVIDGNFIYYDSFATNALAGGNISGIDEVGGYNVVISNNTVVGPTTTNNGVYGIGNGLGDNNTSTPTGSLNGKIISNTVIGMGQSISIKDFQTLSYDIQDNNTSYNGADSCIKISGGTSGIIKSINISNNTASHCYLSGIGFYSPASGTTFSNIKLDNNLLHDNGSINTGVYSQSGISFNTNGVSFSGLSMVGNRVYDSGANFQKYCIALNTNSAVSGVIFNNNQCGGNVTSPFDFVSGSSLTGVFNNNTGMPTPTITGCSATSPAGNGDIGSFLSGTSGSCVATIVPYGTTSIIASNGYVCNGSDLTTPSISIQSASTTTNAIMTTATTSGDKVNFQCRMW